MSHQESYTVLQPVHLDGYGTLEPGATVTLHPRQAVFLLTDGTLKAAEAKAAAPKSAAPKSAAPKSARKEATK